jgi:hypothetical protein
MENKIQGKLTQILPLEHGQSKSGKEWKKQSFVVDTGDQYNPNVCFSLFGDNKIELLNHVTVGQDIEVSFNVSSREYQGKWFHNLDPWRIKKLQIEEPAPKREPQHHAPEPTNDDLSWLD